MKVAFRSLSLIVLGLVVLAVARPASGDVIVQTDTFNAANAPFSDSLSFNTFDPSLGNLTQVSILLNISSGRLSSVLTNNSNSPQTVDYSGVYTVGSVSLTGPDMTSVSASLNTPAATMTGVSFGANETKLVGSNSGGGVSTTSTTNSNLSAYESGSYTSFIVNTVGGISYNGSTSSPSVSIGGSAFLGGSVTITYTYVPSVPEPMSLVMVTLGLGGVYAVRRFRRKAG